MKKILLVEDDEILVRMYKKLFSYNGYDVSVATDGIQGLQYAKQLKPDLIILDVMMPKMNGLELLEKIKNDPTIKSIPTIMLTNLNMDHEVANALANGALLYLVKNEHEPEQIFKIVKNLL